MDGEFYLVAVRSKATGRRVALRRFPVGTWQQIGWWLSDSELIDTEYRVSISLVGANEYRQVPIHDEKEGA